MRVLLAVGLMLFTPLLSASAQGRGEGKNKDRVTIHGGRLVSRPADWHSKWCSTPGANWGRSDDAPGRDGKEHKDNKGKREACKPQTPPPPPPPPPPTPPPTGVNRIMGSVYLDSDANGHKDFYDVGVAGRVITLDGPVTASTTTDANGDYAFLQLPGGNFTVCAVPVDGETQTQPALGSGGVDLCWAITLQSGLENWATGFDFGTAPAQPQP